MNKSKRQKKQDARNIKLMENVLNGQTTIAPIEVHESKKKVDQPNRKGGAAPDDESEAEMLEGYARILRVLLPGIMAKLSEIEDPRDTSKITHSLPMLILFGILMFLSRNESRRSANRTIAHSNVLAMVAEFIPGVVDMPHADTLARLLCNIDPEQIDRHYEEMVKDFISSNQFKEVQTGRYRVALDGTQKFARKYEWDTRALSRNAGDEEKERYYVYVLESSLILDNGMTLPLLTEILENKDAQADGESTAECRSEECAKKAETSALSQKQDCETKAFHRLADRLVKLLGKGCVTLVMDGIYASGPVISRCEAYGWEYMIVLKNECLKSVWADFNGLQKLDKANVVLAQWGNRLQEFHWSNGIEYIYGNNHTKLKLNLVTCTETWTDEHPRSGKKPKNMKTEYAWLSSKSVNSTNAFQLCTVVARSRWRIENFFLTAKHQGYSYSHCYSYNWNAMKGFHYLMKYGIFLNVVIAYSVELAAYVKPEGKQGFVLKVWKKITEGKWPLLNTNSCTQTKVYKASAKQKIKYPKLINIKAVA